MEKVEVSVKDSEGVLTILTGQAPKQLEEKSYSFEGDINAPFEFLQRIPRQNVSYNLSRTVVEITELEDNLNINLLIGYDQNFNIQISGSLVSFPALENFGINKHKVFGPKALADLVKGNRAYFETHEANAALVSQLRSLSVQAISKIEQSSDDRGNKRLLSDKQITGNIPESFIMNIPVFKSADPVRFKVDVCCDVRENIIEVWLESAELREHLQSSIRAHIMSAKADFGAVGIPVLVK
jgi:hypothetical protein